MKKQRTNIAVLMIALMIPGAAQAIPIADLFAGATITADDKLFDQWEILISDPLIDTANIDVTPFDDGSLDPGPGLDYSISGGALNVTGLGTIDFGFSFRVSVLDGSLLIKDNTLSLQSAGLFIITDYLGTSITEEVFDAAGNSLGTKQVEFSEEVGVGGIADLTDSLLFDPISEIFVTTNISVWATDPAETASLGGFSQRFSQTAAVPEPSTLLLMTVGLVGISLLRGRRYMRA